MISIDWVEHSFIYLVAGTCTGLVSGLLGIGGGIITVPTLLYLFYHMQTIPIPLQMQVATGTSLAIMMFTSYAAVHTHRRNNMILWPIYHKLWPGIVLGAILGALLAHILPPHLLEKIFGLMLLLVLMNLLFNIKTVYTEHFPNRWLGHLFTCGIGLCSGLLGIGGGTLSIPYLTYCGVNTRKISPLANLCTLTAATIGTAVFILNGLRIHTLPLYTTGYVYWPAVLYIIIPSILMTPMGAKLSHVLPVKQLRYLFAGVLLLVIINLLT